MAHAASLADQLIVFIDQAGSAVDLRGFPFNGDLAIVQLSGHVQRGFQQFEVLIERAE